MQNNQAQSLGDRLLCKVCCDKTGKSFYTKQGRFRSDIRTMLFMIRAVKHWHRLPTEVVEAL